jgi:hypothetical protein
MMMRFSVHIVLATVVLGCAAEKPSDVPRDAEGGSAASIGDEAACAHEAKVNCARMQECNSYQFRVGFGDEKDCETRWALGCRADLGLPGSHRTAAVTESCTVATEKTTCDQWFRLVEVSECFPQAGTLANGAVCATGGQCESLVCNRQEGSSCGTCGPVRLVGDPCLRDAECVGDLLCLHGVCGEAPSVGAPCLETCVLPFVCKGGTCARRSQAGQACSSTPEDSCDVYNGLFCGRAHVCQVGKYAALGEVCNEREGIYCDREGTCRSGSGTTGTCAAAAEDGADCDDTSGPYCRYPAQCIGGFCRIADPKSCK